MTDSPLESYRSHPVDPDRVRASLEQVIYRDAQYTIRIQDVVGALQDAGLRVYVAGGACRDWLTGAAVKDVDLSLDGPMTHAHEALRHRFPDIDPVLGSLERVGMLRWGDAASGGVDLNILRSHHDIQNDDMGTTTFVARGDLREDALTRDFSVNAFYYPCHGSGRLLDPLDCGLNDLRDRVLRLVAHRRILDTSYRTTCRIIQFLCRGYAPAPDIDAHLEHHADRDLQGMGERLVNWIPHHLGGATTEQEAEFQRRLYACARQEASRKVLDHVFSQLAARRPPAG
jgi:hypothetical protein